MIKKFKYNKDFILESSEILHGIEIGYSDYGSLNKYKNNVIWCCHALTGSSEVNIWWNGLIGDNKLFNPNNYYIICANILGSCYGSTGPLSINPVTKKPYYHTFPTLSIRDIINSFILLKKYLKIKKINTLIGGSLGGMQALEWSIMDPNICDHLVLIATSAKSSPWCIAFNETQRMAIEVDKSWTRSHKKAGITGMKTARSIAILSYRTYNIYEKSQLDKKNKKDFKKEYNYKASNYQRYQGEKFSLRFNAFSYWILTKLLDSHDIGRNRKSIKSVLSSIIYPDTIIIGITSDILFPPKEQKLIAKYIQNSKFYEINSIYGHDGFLLEYQKIHSILKKNI